ncbi:MAG: hypothetical protein AAGI17_01215 [Planctomycetota bacterium]
MKHRRKPRRVWVGPLGWVFLIVIFGYLWLDRAEAEFDRFTPPPGVHDLQTFLSWRPQPPGVYGVVANGEKFLLVESIIPDTMHASGPAAYVFDTNGSLVDWEIKTGEGLPFDTNWYTLPQVPVPLESASEWLKAP